MMKAVLRALAPRGIYPHRILAGALRGRQIVTSWHDYPAAILGRTERELVAWFSDHIRPGETWLDVGAHYGYTAIALCQCVGASGRVFAFEPLLRTAGHIEHTRSLNRLSQLTVVPFGLASPESIEVLQLPSTRGMVDNTLLTKVGGDRRKKQGGTDVIEDWSTALFASLDWVWPRICQGREEIDGVKIDVQGMELKALEGMLRILRSARPVLIVELHHGVDRVDFLRLLGDAGYTNEPVAIEAPAVEGHPMELLDNHSYLFTPA